MKPKTKDDVSNNDNSVDDDDSNADVPTATMSPETSDKMFLYSLR